MTEINTQVLLNGRKVPVLLLVLNTHQYQLTAAGKPLVTFTLEPTAAHFSIQQVQLMGANEVKGVGYAMAEGVFRLAYQAEQLALLSVECPAIFLKSLYECGFRVIAEDDHYDPYQGYASRPDLDYQGFKTKLHLLQQGDKSQIQAIEQHKFYPTAKILAERAALAQGIQIKINTVMDVAKYFNCAKSINACIQQCLQTNHPMPLLKAVRLFLPTTAIPQLEQKYLKPVVEPKAPLVMPESSGISEPAADTPSGQQNTEAQSETSLGAKATMDSTNSTPVPSESTESRKEATVTPQSTNSHPEPDQRLLHQVQNMLEQLGRLESKIEDKFYTMDKKIEDLKSMIQDVKDKQKDIQQKQNEQRSTSPNRSLPGYYRSGPFYGK